MNPFAIAYPRELPLCSNMHFLIRIGIREIKNLKTDQSCVDFVFEMGTLANIPRSGNVFLSSGNQTVAEHSFRCATIVYLLSQVTALFHDPYKLLCMCLFHDAHETRILEAALLSKK